MATNALTPQQQAPVGSIQKDVRSLLMSDAFKSQIAKAMPEAMSPDVLLRVATTTIQKNQTLMECTQTSLMQCVLECAQLGLLPDGILGQAYIVPYKKVATLQIGYRGILELARRSNQIKYVVAEAVYDCDDFSISYAPKRTIVHDPAIDNETRGEKERGKYLPKGFRGVYALVLYKDDTIDFEYLPLHKVERIRAASQAGDKADSPWLNHFEEMARKTAIRALGKRLPLSADDQRRVIEDEYRDAGVLGPQLVDATITDLVRNEEAESLMQQLGWPEGKRAQCRRNFSGNPGAMLDHLRAEVSKMAGGSRNAATSVHPATAEQTVVPEPEDDQQQPSDGEYVDDAQQQAAQAQPAAQPQGRRRQEW